MELQTAEKTENVTKLSCMTLKIYLYLPPILKASFIPSIYLNIRSLTPLTKAIFLLYKLLSLTVSNIFRRMSLNFRELPLKPSGHHGISICTTSVCGVYMLGLRPTPKRMVQRQA